MKQQRPSWFECALPVVLLLSVAPACTEDPANLTEEVAAIAVGPGDATTPPANAVVSIATSAECSGVLVAPDKVLTSPMCGYWDLAKADGGWHAWSSSAWVRFGRDDDAPELSTFAYHARVPLPGTIGLPFAGLVLLQLESMVPIDIATARRVALTRPSLPVGMSIVHAGYGGGRDRTLATSGFVADWTTDRNLPVNWIRTLADVRGVGDRGTNLEAADMGSPLFVGGATGDVIGVLNGWGPSAVATYGNGDGDQPDVSAWLGAGLNDPTAAGWARGGGTGVRGIADPIYSSSESGRPIFIDEISPGQYDVKFIGAGRSYGSIHVTALGDDERYCKVAGTWQGADDLILQVNCFDATGVLASSRFVVTYARQHAFDGRGVAHVSTANFGGRIANQWNTSGQGNRIAGAAGSYTVTLPGFTTTAGTHAQVTAIGWGPERCQVVSWAVGGMGAPGATVNVFCTKPNGAPVAADFNLLFTGATTAHQGPGGHAWADQPDSVGYTPDSGYSYNSASTTIWAGYTPDYQYVGFKGLRVSPGAPMVSSYGRDGSYCKLRDWTGPADVQIQVRCFDTAGSRVRRRFTVAYQTR